MPNSDITIRPQVVVGGPFALTDHHGRHVTRDSYAGRFVLIFFGFTHCKKVCPRALGRLSQALDSIRPVDEQFQALYITVNPERDSPAVMKAFLETSYPRFTGLTGTPEEIAAVKQAYRVFSKAVADPTAEGGYVVPHTAFTYVLNPAGEFVTHFPDSVDEADLAQRLKDIALAAT